MSDGESTLPNEPPPQQIDPYAILKVDRSASDEAIQKAYKLLSRAFHPDKYAPGPTRDKAQEIFVSFKNAHDILSDPVQRQAYDDLGHTGIAFVKRSLHGKDPDALYPTLGRLHRAGQSKQARLVLNEAVQQANVERKDSTARVSCTLEFPCTIESTGVTAFPEMQEAHMSFAVSSDPPTPDNKWTITVGGNSNVENGKGAAAGQVSVGYMLVQGTNVDAEVDFSNPFKLSIGSTRTLSSRTLVTASARTIPNSNSLGLSLVSQRSLFDNKLRGTWALGVGTDLKFHYGLFSFTTLNSKYPQCTAKLNLGMSSFPVKLSAKHEFDSGQTGYVSYSWSPTGVEVKTIFARALSSYVSWSMGIKHATQSGLIWLLQLERNDVVFRIPITITSRMSPVYWENLLLLSFISFLIDETIGDMISSSELVESKKKSLKHESSLLVNEKSRQDAEQQVQLMIKTAETCKTGEEGCNGLVIRKATYWVDGGESMDATTQLQFWVNDSKIQLPATPKSDLLGFYKLKPASELSRASQSWWDSWMSWLSSNKSNDSIAPRPKLTVRYAFHGKVYEITIEDSAELGLPNTNALCLGLSNVVLE